MTQEKLHQLALLGIEDIRDIPTSFPLTELQSRIRACVLEQEEYISLDLLDELMDVEHPIHFLDFETVSPAIPRYTGTRPYQALPFQWSDHILYEDGRLEHREYLSGEDKDPREEFTETLLEALGDKGTIFIYTTYERRVITKLAEDMAQFHDRLLAVMNRFRDLHAAIKKGFYHPDFHGSFSLKAVLPVIVPSMSYETLAIQEGSQASFEFLRMLDPLTPVEERESIRRDLLAYCAHDTLAMARTREELLNRF
jgi:hypothetical protein